MNILGIDPGKCKFGAALVTDAGAILFRCVKRFQINQNAADSAVFNLIYVPLYEIMSEISVSHSIDAIALGDKTASKDYLNAVSLIIKKNEKFGRITLNVVDESHTTEAARALYHKNNPPFFLIRWLPHTMIPVFCDVDDYAAVAIALKFIKISLKK
ncbi:MAG TPA: hypothetical protein PK467_02230 [Candidatus Wallbacteria bacterium]|mgnify:FL=1|nr:hypothetical protein [Candidatus Wallbacteria bacterium]